MSNYSTYKGVNNITLDVTERDGTGSMIAPSGTTAERPSATTEGQLRYNTTDGYYEQYTSVGWTGIAAPPIITTISGTINENTNSTITVNGSNFASGAVVYIVGDAVSGTDRALTTTFVNSGQLTAATAAASVNYVAGAAFDVKVVNASGLAATLSPAGDVDSDPIWSTSAGTLATINDAYGSYSPIATLSASDPDGTSITYAVASGSLPGNVTLNSSTGAISGDPTNETDTSTTYSFTASATSNTQAATRSFNIIVNRASDGSSSTRAATTAQAIYNLSTSTFNSSANGVYWIKPTGRSAIQVYCEFNSLGGWMLYCQGGNGGAVYPTSTSAVGTITTLGSNGKHADADFNAIPWNYCWISGSTGTGSNTEDPNRQVRTTSGNFFTINWGSSYTALTSGTTNNGRNQQWTYTTGISSSARQNGTHTNLSDGSGIATLNLGDTNTYNISPHDAGTGGFWMHSADGANGNFNTGFTNANGDPNNKSNTALRIFWFFK